MPKQTITKAIMICSVAIMAISQIIFAQTSEFKILPSDGAALDRFGIFVSISGDYAIVGAKGDDDNGGNSGSAYIFKRTGTNWAQEAKLLPTDGATAQEFGFTVAISGDYAVVGAPQDDDNGLSSGSAYVYKRSGTSWAQETKLLPSDGTTGDGFGESVSISGDYVVVSAVGNTDNGAQSGSAYVFMRNGTSWSEQSKLLPSDGVADDRFGRSVSISGDYVVVGAYGDDAEYDGYWQGSAYIFKRSGTSWAQEDKLIASDGDSDDEFGWAVSISGDYAVVGALLDNDNGTFSGSAYVFKRSGTSWAQEAKLLPSRADTDDEYGWATNDQFGYSVSISGDNAVVGTVFDTDNGGQSGSAFIFIRSGNSWSQTTKVIASDGVANSRFGESVSISGEFAIVGSKWDDDNGSSSGSAYIYNNFIPSIVINVPADQATIQAAIDASTDGDTVLVQPGTYTENINFSGKSIWVASSDGADVTIIDGNQSGSVVTFTSGEGENSRLEGFTLTNGSGTTVDAYTLGGGIYCTGSSPSIIDCKIISNSVTSSGGGLYLSSSSPFIDHCTISGNTSGIVSGGIRFDNSSSPKLTYCLITGNTAQYGGGMSIYSGSSPWLIHCTFSGNYASIQGGGLYVHGSGTAPIMINSILWDDAAGSSGQEIYICCGPAMTLKHSDVNPSDITGSVTYLSDNINTDPLFVSPLAAGNAPTTGGDYHLSETSPAIDVGIAFFEFNNDTLIDLIASEYFDTAPDMGAFETNFPEPILSVLPDTLEFRTVLVGETAIEPLTVKNTGDDSLHVSSIFITGVDSLNFSVDTTIFTLAPDDSLVLDISFTPNDSGSFSASLYIDSDGGTTSVALVGTSVNMAQTFIIITVGDIVNDGGNSAVSLWGDYDNDGDMDIFVANNSENNFLYENNGNETFTKIAEGEIVTDGGNSQGGSWGDYNNDGYIDLYVMNPIMGNALYRNNGDGTFNKITESVLVTDSMFTASANWGDYDNDGFLDLFVSTWSNLDNILYHNNGDETFSKIIEGDLVNDGGTSGAGNWGDYDNDGYVDLFVPNASGQNNFLYHNNGDGSFSKIIDGDIVNDGGNSAGSSWGDYDNDGDLDLFVSNPNQINFMYQNNGDGSFTKVTDGDIVNEIKTWEASSWGDYDNDGDIDLFVANASSSSGNNYLYHNNGDGTFLTMTEATLLKDNNQAISGTWADYDNDGFLDLFVARAQGLNNLLFHNEGNSNGWINIKLTGAVSNSSAIGARVKVNAIINGSSTWQMQEVSGQTGYRSQNSLNVEFGFGDATIIDSIKVDWPSGIGQVYTDVAINQFMTITEPSPQIALSVDLLDFNYVLVGETATDTVIVTNSGTIDLNVLSISIKGTDSSNFVVDTTSFFITPTSSLLLDVSFTPDDTGSFSASLVIESNGGSASVALSGDGYESGDDYGLVAYYPFDGNASDESGNGNDGVIMGGVTFEASTHGQAARFSSKSTYILLDQPGLNANGWSGITISAWISMSGYTTYGTVVQRGNDTPNYSYSLKVGGTYGSCEYYCAGRFNAALTDSGFSVIAHTFSDTLPLPELNTWYHLVGVYDGISARYYVNGVLDGEDVMPEGFQGANLLDNASYQTRIGGSPTQPNWSDQYLNGLIDEVRFYDRALSDSEIQTLYLGPLPELSTLPDSLYFGDVLVGETSSEPITVKNKGYDTLNVSSISITGVDSLNFSVDTTSFTLAPDDSLVLDVSFTPDDTISFSASLYIESDGGSASVALTGKGYEILSVDESANLPKVFSLSQNYPNPFNPVTTIQYELPKQSDVQITIYDLLGRKIITLVNKTQAAGFKSVIWNATNDHGKPVSAGVYLYQIQAGEFVQTKKMVLLK